MKRPIAILLLTLPRIFFAQEQPVIFESGPQRTHLLELFTSQGCSSCPPAETWLSRLKSEPRLWKDFVPLAFHVDYWDQLGWKDPFARKEFTARQQAYAQSWRGDSVYTPGFALDGREWRERTVPSQAKDVPGVLKVTVNRTSVAGEFKPNDSKFDGGKFYVALLAFDQNTKVGAGENSGRNLKQDFVVLDLESTEMPDGKAVLSLPHDVRFGAVAAWITAPNHLDPIQATGGWVR